MRNWPQDEKAIVIDTEEYSGNFERDLVAFITGQVGECNVGRKNADRAQDDLSPEIYHWFDEHVVQTADDHGVLRPASIAPTPGWSNNGDGNETKLKPGEKMKYPAYMSVEFVLDDWPTFDVMEVILDRVKFFCDRYSEVSRVGARIGEACKPLTLTGVRMEKRSVKADTVKRFQPPTDRTGWLEGR